MKRICWMALAFLSLACGDGDASSDATTSASGSGGASSSSSTASSGGAGTGATGGGGGMGSGGGSGGASSDAVSDDFERQMLGSDWAVLYPPPPNDQVRIIDASDLGMGPGTQGFFLVNWRATSFDPDQFCEASIPVDVDPDWLHQVYVRWRASDGARYGFHYNGDPNQSGFGNWAFKYDGVPSAQTRIIAEVAATTVTPPGPGDTLRIEVVGFELRGYKNGTLVLTATDGDGSKIAAGEPGLAARWANGNGSTSQNVKVWESWAGGSL